MTKITVNPSSVFNSTQYGFSQAVVATGRKHIFLSGQVGIDKDEKLAGMTIEQQMRLSCENMQSVIEAAGGKLSDITMLRLYIKVGSESAEDQNKIADILKQFFPENPPASSWIIVSGLSLPEWLIEVEAEALID